MTALIVDAFNSLGKSQREAIRGLPEDQLATHLSALGLAYRNWAVTYPQRYQLIFGTPIPGYEAPPETTTPLARSSLGVLIRILEEGMQSGAFQLPEDPPALSPDLLDSSPEIAHAAPLLTTALALWGLVHGLVSLELFNHFQPLLADPEELFRQELANRMQILLI